MPLKNYHELPSGLVWKQEGHNVHLSDDDSGMTIHINIIEFLTIASLINPMVQK